MDQNEFEIEKRKLELEQTRIKYNREKFWIGTVAIGIISLIINYSIQNQKIEQEKVVQENQHLSKFVDHIINKDASIRRDIAQYFSVLALLEPSRTRWDKYLSITENLVEEANLKEKEVILASQQRDSIANLLFVYSEGLEDYNKKINNLQSKINQTSSSEIEKNEFQKVINELNRKDSLYKLTKGELLSKNKTIINQQKELSDLRSTPKAIEKSPLWLDIALKEVGVQELVGKKDNKRIVNYAKESGFEWIEDDETPWNSIFMNWIFSKAGIKGSGKANARSWLDWGTELSIPKKGCVVIFWRGSIDSWKGHVAVLLEETDNKVKVLGGNQSNGVNPEWYSKETILGYRWPNEN